MALKYLNVAAAPGTFISKINSSFTGLAYSSVFAYPSTYGLAIWADTVHTYVAGVVGPNAQFPQTNDPFQGCTWVMDICLGPSPSGDNAFVVEVDSTWGQEMYSTYLGGSNGSTVPTAIAVSPAGDVYVAGDTSSSAFPGAPALTPNPSAGFVSKLTPQLNELYYTTLLGASINGIAVDLRNQRFPSVLSNVEVYTAGYRFTGSTAQQAEDAFAVKLVEPAILVSK